MHRFILLLGGIEIFIGGVMTAWPYLLPQWVGLVLMGIGVLTVGWALWPILARRKAGISNGPRIPPGRQPIYFAGQYLKATASWPCADDWWITLRNELQQAAKDGSITIWGRKPYFIGDGDINPLETIPQDYWRDHYIDVELMWYPPETLDEKGVFTKKSEITASDEIFWDTHVDTTQIRKHWPPISIWRRIHLRSPVTIDKIGCRDA